MSYATTPGSWVTDWAGAYDFYFRVWVGNQATEDVNHAPVISEAGITADSTLVPVNTPVNLTANFSDQDAGDSHKAIWTWIQGNPSVTPNGQVNGNTVTGTHTYDQPGVYEVSLRVEDRAGAEAVQSFRYVVVYDPTAGFVTGGGWFTSPAGAFIADPSVTGKALFGFVSKYQKGAGVPTGNTQFEFQAANLYFRSTGYEWLVIAGSKAQYKGSGSINGEGDYGFLLTATDGQAQGGGGADRLRVKIWDKSSGIVVYDNQLNVADGAVPTTLLGGGSIVIHK
jgi:PKD repeat protein